MDSMILPYPIELGLVDSLGIGKDRRLLEVDVLESGTAGKDPGCRFRKGLVLPDHCAGQLEFLVMIKRVRSTPPDKQHLNIDSVKSEDHAIYGNGGVGLYVRIHFLLCNKHIFLSGNGRHII